MPQGRVFEIFYSGAKNGRSILNKLYLVNDRGEGRWMTPSKFIHAAETDTQTLPNSLPVILFSTQVTVYHTKAQAYYFCSLLECSCIYHHTKI